MIFLQVKFQNIEMTFDDKTVLNDINFVIPEGKLVSILGPSGCGKSTTLMLISGLTFPTQGDIYFGDKKVTKLDAVKRKVGMVFQNYALYPHLTVLENIMFPLKMAKVSKAERQTRARDLAKLVQIEDQLDKKPKQLSGGQQQRVAIARALAKKPSVLLMDEPLSNLDARLRIEMREEIRRIQQETGITTIFVTHDQEEALSISDQVMVLNAGAIQQYANPVDLYAKPANKFVAQFIGTPVINILAIDQVSPRFADKLDLPITEIAEVGVRSEDLVATESDDYLLEGRVTLVERVGKDTTVHIDKDGQGVLATNLAFHPEEGQVLRLVASPEAVHCFNRADQTLTQVSGRVS